MKLRVSLVALGIVLVLVAVFVFYRRQNMPLNTIPFEGMSHSLDFSPDGKTLCLCTDSGISLYDTKSWKQQQVLLCGHFDWSYWKTDNQLLTLGASPASSDASRWHDGSEMTTWDVRKRTFVRRIILPYCTLRAISPDLVMVALSSRENNEIVNTRTGHLRRGFSTQRFFESCFSPDGRYFACVASSKGDEEIAPVQVWDTHTWREVSEVHTHQIQGCCLQYSPNGRLLATGTPKAITLWDTTTWQVTRIIPARFKYLFRLRFSDDGTRLAGGGRFETEDRNGHDFFWTLWDPKNGREVAERHQSYFWEFLPGSKVAFSQDDNLRNVGFCLWGEESGNLAWASQGRVASQNKWASQTDCALSPDNSTLVTATSYRDEFQSFPAPVGHPPSTLQVWNMPQE